MKTLTKTRNLIICIFTAVLFFVTALFSLRPANVYADSAYGSEYYLNFLDAKINEEDLNSQNITFYFDLKDIAGNIGSYDYYFSFDVYAYVYSDHVEPEYMSFNLQNIVVRTDSFDSLMENSGFLPGGADWQKFDVAGDYNEIQALESAGFTLHEYPVDWVNGYCSFNSGGIVKSMGFTEGLSVTDKGATKQNINSEDVEGIFYATLDLNNFHWNKYGYYDDFGKPSGRNVSLFLVSNLMISDRTSNRNILTDETLVTPIYSYIDLLSKYYEEQEPENPEELPTYTEEEIAQRIEQVREGTLQNITIEYLSRIGTSKFAEKKTATVQTKVYDDKSLNYDYLKTVFNVQTLDCFDIVATEVYCLAGSRYVVRYAKDTYLASRTVDGNIINQFLDINNSFYDAFQPLLIKGYINQELYDWFFAQIKNSDNSLNSLTYTDRNIYGYFTWCVLPKTYTMNALLSEVFDGGTKYSGTIKQYAFESSLSAKQYDALLRDYNYAWFKRIWSDVHGFFSGYNATYIMLVVEPTVKSSVVSDSGSTDVDNNHNYMRNKVEETIDDIKELIDENVGGFFQRNKNILITMACSALIIGVVMIVLKRKKKEKD